MSASLISLSKPPTDFSDDLTFLWLETWSQRREHDIDDELVFSIRIITSFTTRGIEVLQRNVRFYRYSFDASVEKRDCETDGMRYGTALSLQALYKQQLLNMQTLRLRVTLATEAAEAEEGLLFLALWT
ncbi:hypothetical protein EDB89DRAFT_2079139 [Lactarius sanguifluus]|nr:hypothetical protein EDB89DRAFT_2079139 [Lactarius sanguifluus]